jgi:hypothetical protein
MQRSIVVGGILTALAAVAGIAWLLFAGVPEPVAAAPRASSPAPAVATERPVPTSIGPTEPIAEDDTLPAEAPLTAQRIDVTPAQDADEIVVRVVDADELPVAGARVLLLASANEEDQGTFWHLDEVDELMSRRGTERSADDAGVLRIARPTDGPTLLLASHGTLWGKTRVEHDEDGALELVLATDATLRAAVVDLAGAAVLGATVRIRQVHSWGGWTVRSRAVEGEAAIATFRHVQETVTAVESDRHWAVGVEALLEEQVEHALDPENFPGELITLVIPATGAVEVRIVDEEWKPLIGEARVSLGIVRQGEPQRLSPFSEIRRTTLDVTAEEGVARFPMVALGAELEVAARRGQSRVATRAYAPGPVRAGGTATLDVRLGSDHPVVVLRAVYENGEPLANMQLLVRIELTARHTSNMHDVAVTTDDDARFRVDVEADWTEDSERALIVTLGSREQPDATAVVDLSRKLQPGLNDLGQVTMAEPALLVRGRVVTPAGDPISQADLTLETMSEARQRWTRERRFEYESDADGAFEVRGLFPGDSYRLGAQRSGWAGQPREFRAGETDLVLEMTRAGAIVGSVLVDEEIPRDSIYVELTGEIEYLDYPNRRTHLSEEGTFELEQLLPGTYGVRVRIDQHREVLREIEEVVVLSNETTRDARLAAIDLRGALFARQVTFLVDGGDDARVQGQLSYGPVGAERLEGHLWFHERELTLVSTDDVLDVEVSARGFRAVLLDGVQGDFEVRLEQGLKVRVVLRGDASIPDPPIFVKVALTPADGSHGSLDFGAPAFDEKREIMVRVPNAGEMSVRWIIERRSGGGSMATTANVEPEQTVQVLDQQGQTVEVTLSEEQMQSIVTSLNR